MATRLLSFLNDIEQALLKERAATGPAWEFQRMVNFKDGLARMTLSTDAPVNHGPAGGAILIQSFLLADGSMCVKATLNWDRSPAATTIAVHANPQVDWSTEAAQLAKAWLAGPPATATVEAVLPTPAVAVTAAPVAGAAVSG